MRLKLLVLLQLLLVVAARADELLPSLKVGTDTYTNVTVTTVTATDIYFKSPNGLGSAKLKSLDPALQKHFGYDPAKVAAEEKAKFDTTIASTQTPFDPVIDTNNAKSAMDEAIHRVKVIVNQPVRKFMQTPAMHDIWRSQGGWFHPGAERPDFNTVDIRQTQDLKYNSEPYVTSDINPGIVFLGPDIEFNSMTKYFYVDRTVPKKKLTEAEMVEINRLYRIIGKCETLLHPIANDPTVIEVTSETDPVVNPPMFSRDYFSLHKKQLVIFGSAVLVICIILRLLFGKRTT